MKSTPINNVLYVTPSTKIVIMFIISFRTCLQKYQKQNIALQCQQIHNCDSTKHSNAIIYTRQYINTYYTLLIGSNGELRQATRRLKKISLSFIYIQQNFTRTRHTECLVSFILTVPKSRSTLNGA